MSDPKHPAEPVSAEDDAWLQSLYQQSASDLPPEHLDQTILLHAAQQPRYKRQPARRKTAYYALASAAVVMLSVAIWFNAGVVPAPDLLEMVEPDVQEQLAPAPASQVPSAASAPSATPAPATSVLPHIAASSRVQEEAPQRAYADQAADTVMPAPGVIEEMVVMSRKSRSASQNPLSARDSSREKTSQSRSPVFAQGLDKSADRAAVAISEPNSMRLQLHETGDIEAVLRAQVLSLKSQADVLEVRLGETVDTLVFGQRGKYYPLTIVREGAQQQGLYLLKVIDPAGDFIVSVRVDDSAEPSRQLLQRLRLQLNRTE